MPAWSPNPAVTPLQISKCEAEVALETLVVVLTDWCEGTLGAAVIEGRSADPGAPRICSLSLQGPAPGNSGPVSP